MSKFIVVVGSINLDLVARVAKIPRPGETVLGERLETFPGGKGANQAVAAARLGCQVCLLGKIGNDEFAHRLRQELRQANVDVSAVEEVKEPSGVALISTDVLGDNAIVVTSGANARVTPEFIDRHIDRIQNATMILTQLEIPLETVQHLASTAKKLQVPLVLDPAPANHLPETLLQDLAWITPNEPETSTLLGQSSGIISDASEAATALRNRGVRNVILKLGERGCFLALEDGRRAHIPSFRVEAIDTTAAGDAFNGALADALCRGEDPVEAAIWASAVAAISVTRRGAQPSMPTLQEVNQFLKSAQEVNQFLKSAPPIRRATESSSIRAMR